jgi:outer membrane protein OmpA-like peptidoglycan-associated protein
LVRARVTTALAVIAVGCMTAVRAASGDPAEGSERTEHTVRLEASGFVGVDWFGKHTSLGDSFAADQVPSTSAVVGGRVGWLALDARPGDVPLALAIEAELAFAPAFTGSSAGAGRMTYFAPVFEWRGQAVLRFVRWPALAPHLVIGAGADSVMSHSPFMADDTDPIAYWGAGVTAEVAPGWQLRLDLHQGVMPARGSGALATAELELGIGTVFGGRPRRAPAPVALAVAREPAATAPPDPDRDGDGVSDSHDACPDQPGDGADGCPVDPDGDGVIGDADRCPDQPEDHDGFQDEDGCPDPDNDGDGIDDAHDACPNDAETVNGWQDADGCPDAIPDDVTAALAIAIRFERSHARITAATAARLRPLRAALERYPELRVSIVGHPERAGGDDLARRRAEATKWYLVDQGIPEDRFTTAVGPVAGIAVVAFRLATAPP